jgi:predicted kinase
MAVIGLIGAKSSGKSEAARCLVEYHGFERLRFADGLKRMLRALGLTEAQVDGDSKEEPSDLLCGQTPRWAMQSLGTEWGRKLIGDNIWAAVTQHHIMTRLCADPHANIVVDDVRFPNEVIMLQQLGGQVWRVRRPAVEPSYSLFQTFLAQAGLSRSIHPSELYWKVLAADHDIFNDGGILELRTKIGLLVRKANAPEFSTHE